MNPRCPVCNRPGKPAGDFWQCPSGHGFFEPDDEPTHNDPAKSLEAKERHQKRRSR
jgi:hypothetical protein